MPITNKGESVRILSTCFFIGHRDAPESIRQMLDVKIEKFVNEHDINEFIVGHYGNFDRMAANAVIRAKIKFQNIKLNMLFPYYPADSSIKLPDGFDCSLYPPGMEYVPKRFAIVKANQYMIDHCDALICYVWHPASNARKLYERAKRRQTNGLM